MKPIIFFLTATIAFALLLGCKHSAPAIVPTAPGPTSTGTTGTTIDTTSLHYRISKINGKQRIWRVTEHDTTPVSDTTYFSADTFAVTFLNDSVLTYYSLPFSQYSQSNKCISYFRNANTGGSGGVQIYSFKYYYRADSLIFYSLTANGGGYNWETTKVSTY